MMDLPPARFDHPYNGPVIEQVIPDADAQCRKVGAKSEDGAIILGCSFKVSDTCMIILRLNHPLLNQLRRHEIGHCNGWSDKHEQ